MLKIGLTGGIGTGKTTVAKIFEILKIPVYYSDLRAKKILYSEEVKNKIREIFGEEVFDGQEISRQKLAKIVFSDAEKLKILNSIIHPLVKQDYKIWLEQQKSPYVIKESALIFEANLQNDFDFIITVYTPLNQRIERIKKRDNISEAEIKKRIDKQYPEDLKLQKADFIIFNDNDSLLLYQVLKLDKLFRRLANANCFK